MLELVHSKNHTCLYYAQLMPNMRVITPTVPNVPLLCLPDAQNACTIPVFPKLHAAAFVRCGYLFLHRARHCNRVRDGYKVAH